MNAAQLSIEQWQVAEKGTRCRDVWRLSSLRMTALHAYRRLDQKGDIAISYPVLLYRRRGQMVVWYDTNMPHEWALDALKAEERRLTRDAEKERDALEAQIRRLAESGDEDMLPTFEAAIARYAEVQSMLEKWR